MPVDTPHLFLHLLEINGIDPESIDASPFLLVVPPLTATFEDLCHDIFDPEPLTISTSTQDRVKIGMDDPGEISADRIVDAAAAFHLYRPACASSSTWAPALRFG